MWCPGDRALDMWCGTQTLAGVFTFSAMIDRRIGLRFRAMTCIRYGGNLELITGITVSDKQSALN